MQGGNHLLAFRYCLGFFIIFLFLSCDKDSEAPLNLVKAAADTQNQVKMKTIDAAAAAYRAERRRSPQTLDELVRTGYLTARDIVDENGDPYAYSPESGWDYVPERLTKSCGRCGKSVADTSRPGDRCPHCGVVWAYEQKF
jgi:hypothetical protein